MNILYLNHPESDYGGCFLHDGLCRVFGSESVFDYPTKRSYHGEAHTYSLPNIPNGMTAPCPWMRNWPTPWDSGDDEECYQQILRKLRENKFDVVVLESLRPLAVAAFLRIKLDMPSFPGHLPVIAHDGEDYHDIRYDLLGEVKPDLLLKRELLLGKAKDYRFPAKIKGHEFTIHGWPFCCGFDPLPVEDKREVDAVFMAGATWEYRQRVIDGLREETDSLHTFYGLSPDKTRTGGEVGLLPWEQYIALLAASKCGINVRGFGVDTLRFWETAAHTLVLTDPRPLLFHKPYTPNLDCLEYSSPEHCRALVHQIAVDDEMFAPIREEGIAHTLKYHTSMARAVYLTETLIPEVRK